MKKNFEVAKRGYLKNQGVEVMAFNDDYAAGHQSAVSIIMHGNCVASGGDSRIRMLFDKMKSASKSTQLINFFSESQFHFFEFF